MVTKTNREKRKGLLLPDDISHKLYLLSHYTTSVHISYARTTKKRNTSLAKKTGEEMSELHRTIEDTFKLPLQAQGVSKFLIPSSSWQMRHSTFWISGSCSSYTATVQSRSSEISMALTDWWPDWEDEEAPPPWFWDSVSTHETRWSLILTWIPICICKTERNQNSHKTAGRH